VRRLVLVGVVVVGVAVSSSFLVSGVLLVVVARSKTE
jgi:hypothetical protein